MRDGFRYMLSIIIIAAVLLALVSLYPIVLEWLLRNPQSTTPVPVAAPSPQSNQPAALAGAASSPPGNHNPSSTRRQSSPARRSLAAATPGRQAPTTLSSQQATGSFALNPASSRRPQQQRTASNNQHQWSVKELLATGNYALVTQSQELNSVPGSGFFRAPAATGTPLIICRDTLVELLETKDEWVRIRSASGVIGWLPRSVLRTS